MHSKHLLNLLFAGVIEILIFLISLLIFMFTLVEK